MAAIRVLITGAAGFLGTRIVQELRELAASRGSSIHIRGLDLVESGTCDETWVGDISDATIVRDAAADVDVIIHSAAMIDWGNTPRARIFAVNLQGTRNVVEAAHRSGVRGVVYTGTMDAVMDGGPLPDIDEDQPYPDRFMDSYSESKALAEQAVIAANTDTLRTVVLRSCGMYGEADPYHMENVLTTAREGKLTFRLGSAGTVFEHVYVGNVAYAHALATFAILDDGNEIAGRTYFVTDQKAENFFEFMRKFLEPLGYQMPPMSRTVPAWAAMLAGRANERFAKLVQPVWKLRPVLTRSSVSVLTNTISIKSTRLRDDLGYMPRYSEDEAFERVMAYYAPRFGRT